MATVDDKVVAMSFESSKFEQGIDKAINALNKLKEALSFPKAGKGLEDVNAAAKKVDLSHIAKGVDEIKSKLGALSVAALAVFANLAMKAVDAGIKMVKALTIDPIIQGYKEYETQLNAVQTILANTQAAGTKLKDVNKALNELNKYADKTIYNFSEMTRNIGTFTAAGVDLKTSVASIKGIANLAAVSGSNAQQASTAMYQLSQAISSGTVKLQDWNSVVNAGMGGTVFQRALAQTAEHMGTLKKGAVTLSGAMKNVTIGGESFRQSLASAGPGKKSWLTSDVLTTTLKQLSGDMTDAQLKAQGWTDVQIKAIQTQAKMAVQAATQVKTLTQLLETTKEAVGSGWAQTWQIIFGDFGEAKKLFTSLSNSIGEFVSASADARNKVLKDWKDLGGRTLLISALKQAFHDLAAVLRPIKEAFRDIFPATTGKQLYDLTVRFKALVDTLAPSPTTIENLRRTFRGLFALLDIGKQIIGGIFTVFGQLFGVIGSGAGSFLEITGNIGDFLVKVDEALKKGDRLHNFFVALGTVLSVPLKVLGQLKDALGALFAGFSSGGFSGQMNAMTKAMTPFQKILAEVGAAWSKFLASFGDAGRIMQPAVDALIQLLQGFGPAISSAITNMNFEAILQVIRTGLLGGMYLLFRNFFGKGSLLDQISKGFGEGIIGNISKSFDALSGSMQAMQQNIKAKTLKEIAIAVALLAASVVALSLVDPKRLNAALSAMTIAFVQLLGAMKILTQITASTGFIKLPLITGSLILLAGAIDLLSLAVIALSRLSWGEMLKGLGAVGALLLGMVAITGPLSKGTAGMIKTGIGMTAIAVALNLLALAVRQFGGMNFRMIAQGLAGVAIGLVLIAGAMKLMPKSLIITGAGLIAVAIGLRILANAVAAFGGMDWKTLGKGMLGVAASLVIIAGAMRLMPPGMVVTAAGLLLVAVALQGIAKAVTTMGGLSLSSLAKGLGGLAASLLILAGAMYLMEGAVVGAAALTVAAAGIALLAPALVKLGKLSWRQIIKGLVALAGVFVLIGAAAVLLQPAIPAMLGFGAALIVVGAGLTLAGAGIFLIATGLSALLIALPSGVGILVNALMDLVAGLLKNIKFLALGLLDIVKALADVAPKFVVALAKILGTVVDAIIKLSPKIEQAFAMLIDAVLKVIHDNEGKIVQAGFDLIIALLAGIKNNISRVVASAVDIIVKFLNTIVNNLNRIIAAGVQIVGSLVKGILNNVALIVNTVTSIISKFVEAIGRNLGVVATAGLNILTKLLAAIANNLGSVVKMGANVIVNFINGVANAGPRIITAATNMMIKFINAIARNSVRLADAGAQAIIYFLNGVATVIEKREPEMLKAGARIGVAIVQGMVNGIGSMAGALGRKVEDMFKSLPGKARKILHLSSPSKVFYDIGQNIILGLANGMTDSKGASKAAEDTANGIISMFNNVFQIRSPSKVMHDIGQMVGQGFADGLTSSASDINDSFTKLNNMLTDAMTTARTTITREEAKLAELRAAKKPDAEAIKKVQEVIAQNEDLLRRTTAGHIALTRTLSDEKNELLGLAKKYDQVATKLKEAQSALEGATKARDEAISGFKEQYDTLPDIVTKDAEGNAIDQLATYEDALRNQAAAVGAYQSTLQQLRKLGLDDETYQKLLREGTADQEFATQLLRGGKTAVQGLNKLDDQLSAEASQLARQAGTNLYQAGVDAAQGLVNGLASQESSIHKQMERIAAEMIRALKKKLKIKSPSEEFAEIGKFSMEGMAKGFSDSSKVMTDAVDEAAKDALTAMQKSMSDASDLVIDPNPTITPILDLTQVRSQAQELGALTAITPITAAVSYGQATTISTDQTAAQAEQVAAAAAGTSIKFEQNDYSPEALTEIEIYRQTKNQLSQLQSALASP